MNLSYDLPIIKKNLMSPHEKSSNLAIVPVMLFCYEKYQRVNGVEFLRKLWTLNIDIFSLSPDTYACGVGSLTNFP